MKNNLLFALIVITIATSCKLKHTNEFEFIDLSIYRDRAQKSYSLKVFQNGKAYINTGSAFYKLHRENNYVFTFNNDAIDTITLLTKSILTSKFDSVYFTDCLSCINYNLIIQTKDKKFKFFHVGDLDSNSKFKKLEDYVIYLNKLIDRSIQVIDSSFKFESWTDSLLPPLPPPPPINDVVNK